MKQQLWLAAVLLGLFTGSFAQGAKTTQESGKTPTFESRAEYVLVPVAVREKSGQVAGGLKQERFRLAVDGRPVPIASFEEVKAGAAPVLLPRTPGVYTNRIANEDRPQRLTVLLLDYLNTPFLNQQDERREVAKFIQRELKPDEPVALLALTRRGLRMLQPFTTSSGDLRLALRRARGELSLSESNGLQWVDDMPVDEPSGQFILRDRIRTTLEQLEQLGNALAGVPGRKVVVWTTGGFPYMPYDRFATMRQSTEFLRNYERVWRTLNQANVALYPIDARGLINTLFEGKYSAANSRAASLGGLLRPGYDRFQQEQDTMRSFAEETGGIACLNRNQYASCIEAAQQEAVDYYLLSFRIIPEMRAKSWHKIQVKVDGRYEVRARQGFTAETPQVADPKDELLLTAKALRSPLEYTGLKLSFQWLDVKPIPPGTKLPEVPEGTPAAKHPPTAVAKFRLALAPNSVEIDTANQNRMELVVVGLAWNEHGEYVSELGKSVEQHLNETELRQSETTGTTVENEVALPPGHLRVRFAVRDRKTGRIGTVEAPIDVAGQ